MRIDTLRRIALTAQWGSPELLDAVWTLLGIIGSLEVEKLQRQRSDWDEPEDAISRATAYRNRNIGPPVSVITAYPGWHRRASQVDVWSGK